MFLCFLILFAGVLMPSSLVSSLHGEDAFLPPASNHGTYDFLFTCSVKTDFCLYLIISNFNGIESKVLKLTETCSSNSTLSLTTKIQFEPKLDRKATFSPVLSLLHTCSPQRQEKGLQMNLTPFTPDVFHRPYEFTEMVILELDTGNETLIHNVSFIFPTSAFICLSIMTVLFVYCALIMICKTRTTHKTIEVETMV